LAEGRAADFGEVEQYATRNPERWTVDDDSEFAQAFRAYMENGFVDERSNCDSADELERLANELSGIAKEYDSPIHSRIASLYGEIEGEAPRRTERRQGAPCAMGT
jgi:hypothetical protein